MTDFVAMAREIDRCWQERQFGKLEDHLAEDVVFVAPGGGSRIEGLERAIGSYRDFVTSCAIDRFTTSDYRVTERGHTVIVDYAWDMVWDDQGAKHHAEGREVLVFAHRDGNWRVVWRLQVAH